MANGVVVEIILRFEGDQAAQIEIIRGYRTLPVDVQVPPDDSFLELVRGEVNGAPAVFLSLKPGEFGPQLAYFVDEPLGIVTVVVGDFPAESDLMKVVAGIERSSK